MERYQQFLQRQKDSLQKQIALLEQEGRQDEANLNKVRLNIVGVFETVYQVDRNPERYERRFDTLTAPWRTRLEQARAHDDHQTIIVEETKLAMAETLHQAFLVAKE